MINILPQERAADLPDLLLLAQQSWQAKLWTALPGIVKDVSDLPGKLVVSVLPSLQAQVQGPSGKKQWVTLPLLINVPVCFMTGGGFTLTMPVKVGAEALVVFASRCIDSWWQSGGVQTQAELRMHDLSDGFAIVGPRSLPNVLPGFNPDNVQLRSDDGTCYMELTPAGGFNVVAPGGCNINGVQITPTGALTAPEEITSTLGGTPHTLTQHKHHQGNDSHGDVEADVSVPFN